MKRRSILLALGLAAFGLTTAGHADESFRWSREWKREGPPLTKRVAFVFDVSGSMRGDPIAFGKREIVTILSLFADDGYFKIHAFDDEVRGFRREWTALPDRDAVDEAADWLARFRGSGNTALAAGVLAALADPSEDLAIVLVTDGEPTGDEVGHLGLIREANARRAVPAPIHVIGVFELDPAGSPFLGTIAEENHGSYVAYERRRLTMH